LRLELEEPLCSGIFSIKRDRKRSYPNSELWKRAPGRTL